MVKSYTTMFRNTHAFLPVRNGIVPNTIHTAFQLTLLSTWVLSLYLSAASGRKTDRANRFDHAG